MERFPPLPRAATQAEIEACQYLMPEDSVKSEILNTTSELLQYLAQPTTMFGILESNPRIPSLQTLYDRLNNHHLAPSLIKELRKERKHVKGRIGPKSPRTVLARKLEDYEDLYFALISRIGDLHWTLTMHLTHFVANPDVPPTPAFAITMAAFHDRLFQMFIALNNVSLVAALHNAVKRGRAEAIHGWRLVQMEKGELTRAEFDRLMNRIYDPPPYGEVEGLEFLGESPAMISAGLLEKYHILLDLEGKIDTKDVRWARKQKGMKRAGKKAKSKEREARGRSSSEHRRRRSDESRKSKEAKRLRKKRSREVEQHDELRKIEHKEQERELVIDAQRHQYQSNAAAQRYSQEQTMGLQLQGFDMPTSTSTGMSVLGLRSSEPTLSSGPEWDSEMKNVSEYTRYMQQLRGEVSSGAQQMVENANHTVRQSLGSPSEPESAPLESNLPNQAGDGKLGQLEGQMVDCSQQSMISTFEPASTQAQPNNFGQAPDQEHAQGHLFYPTQHNFYAAYNSIAGKMQTQFQNQVTAQAQQQWQEAVMNQAQTSFSTGVMSMGKTRQSLVGGTVPVMTLGQMAGNGDDVDMVDSEF